ncbi:MAG: hypothetical protein J0L78_01745 [Planctomycetes bacterium]|nr:hypothetical protein [Planctomycetota bacterium]
MPPRAELNFGVRGDAGMGGSISLLRVNTNPTVRSIFAASVLLGACGVSCLVGCATGSDSTPGSESQSATGQAGPATIAADVIYKPAPWKKTYSEGKRVIRREARADGDSPNRWVIDEFDSPDGTLRGGLVRQTFLERGADGSIFLAELHMVAENKILTFDPALVLMPATLSSEKACVSTSDVTMRDGASDAATKSRGTATQTTRIVRQKGDVTVVESQMIAKFDFTTVERTATLDIVPGRGIVREVQDRSVRFGLLNLSRKTSTVTLIEMPPP